MQGLLINLHIQNCFLKYSLTKQTKNLLALVGLTLLSFAFIYYANDNRFSVSPGFVVVNPDGKYQTQKVYRYTVDNMHPIIANTANRIRTFLLFNKILDVSHTKIMKIINKTGLIKLNINNKNIQTDAHVPPLKFTLFTPLIANQHSVVFRLQQQITARVTLS